MRELRKETETFTKWWDYENCEFSTIRNERTPKGDGNLARYLYSSIFE